MRILIVCSSFRVFGTEMITLKLMEGFKRNGHLQLALTTSWTDGEFSRKLRTLDIPEQVLPLGAVAKKLSWRPMWWTANTLARLPETWCKWARALRQFKPDVVLLTNSKQALLLYPWLRSRPCFLVEHARVERSAANLCLYRRLAARLSGFIAVSDFMRNFYQEMGVADKKICVAKNGPFDQQFFQAAQPDRASPGPDKTKLRLGIVGQIAANKGHECLIEAAQLLCRRGIDFEIIAFGSGEPEYVEYLKEKIVAAKLSGVWRWMGYEREQQTIYGQIDICLMPSVSAESFGMVAAEASAYGLPVIASRIGGLPEIVVDGVTGLLVTANDSAGLAQAIELLILNPDLARRLGIAGRTRMSEQFTVGEMTHRFEQIFFTAIARGA